MEGNFSDLEKLKEYIELANSYFGLDKNRKNSRIATHIILDFYKLVLSNVGTIIDERNFEAKSIPNKFLLIRTHIPGFEKTEDLIKEVEDTRNKVYHNDFYFPDSRKLENLIGNAEEFLRFTIFSLTSLREKGERIRDLKDKVEDGIYNLGFFISLNEGIGYTNELEQFVSREKRFKESDLTGLEDKNLQLMLCLLEIDIRQLGAMYDKAWETCPKCGGKIVRKTSSETHYIGPYDDPEPYAVTYYDIVECEKCGLKLVDEQETIDI